jgi:hypothetical protein
MTNNENSPVARPPSRGLRYYLLERFGPFFIRVSQDFSSEALAAYVSPVPRASITACGFWAPTRNKALAGLSGLRRPCSQFCKNVFLKSHLPSWKLTFGLRFLA